MTAMGVQVLCRLLNKNVSTGDDWWGVRWKLIPESLRCYSVRVHDVQCFGRTDSKRCVSGS